MSETVVAVTMTVGRGRAARLICELAELVPGDRVVDVGCGPGAAVRAAVRRGASATGVDPSTVSLRLARTISRLRGAHGAVFVEGDAEQLPLVDGTASVVWALSSVHHWVDRALGLSECRRVMAPGGRLLLAERRLKPGQHGHGLSPDGADELVAAVEAAGFANVGLVDRSAGRRKLVIVTSRARRD
ncbi:MAG: class I SAM-dependent methyltransferase [Acidimicrobiales bacterium]